MRDVPADPVRTVVERERALHSSAVRRSRAALEDLLDPEFREVGASGRLRSRAEVIAALTTEQAPPVEATQLDGIALGADLVLVTYVAVEGARRSRRMSLWRRTGGAWRVLYHQGTPLPSG